ncbi:hypothetical protein NSS64_07555 [Paenibacillus sp. FSL H8-0122]|uniref:hypothetical protein n=1 Tax=unclassified Paenibacillus TaxID=185978 RepID=UPI0030FB25D9
MVRVRQGSVTLALMLAQTQELTLMLTLALKAVRRGYGGGIGKVTVYCAIEI